MEEKEDRSTDLTRQILHVRVQSGILHCDFTGQEPFQRLMQPEEAANP
jgi:hypothetical protein